MSDPTTPDVIDADEYVEVVNGTLIPAVNAAFDRAEAALSEAGRIDAVDFDALRTFVGQVESWGTAAVDPSVPTPEVPTPPTDLPVEPTEPPVTP